MAAKRREKPTASKENWALGLAVTSLLVSLLQAWNSSAALEEQRAAAVKIQSEKPSGTLHQPWVLMRASNVTDKPIHDAKVSGRLGLLPPDKVGQVFDDMETKVEEIEPESFEPQTLEVPVGLSDEDVANWRAGNLVLVGALRVSWKNPGAWTRSSTNRCFAWIGEPTREIACEDLMQLSPQAAREHVQKVLALPMSEQPQASPPGAAFQPGNN